MMKRLATLLSVWLPFLGGAEAQDVAPSFDRGQTIVEIRMLVWSGFETPNSVAETIEDEYLDPDDLTPGGRDWLSGEIERQFKAKRAEEAGWPRSTDWDLLEAAFSDLNASGIVALHYAGTTQSDGLSDAAEIYDDLKAQGLDPSGFAFYHAQDVDTAIETHELFIAFGTFAEAQSDAPAIASRIIAALGKHGLHATWSGDPRTRIVIRPMDWRKRSPRD
ncbi:DUF6891 domain-containing protein [Rhizobium halophytocola]|uniref:DUF6891 domain-containing protein n=1 Tax=Rhizobium halophytocola TaxID=735519 RepID=A0ABS4E114_9HYPH|nr:hypothetical protein [Rhizobium halophytocola]MBP1851633.1 hypothetical protein [Rhizobium halophytocola]